MPDQDARFEAGSFSVQRHARRITMTARRIKLSTKNSALHQLQQHVVAESFQLASAVTVIDFVLRRSWDQLGDEVTLSPGTCFI